MPIAGTKAGTMGHKQATLVLDVTRSLSASAQSTPTGIDRVERAYIDFVAQLAKTRPVGFLCRDSFIGMPGLRALLAGSDERRKLSKRDIRRHKVPPPARYSYLNVGHSNLDALRWLSPERTLGFVHDMIPLDYPGFQTEASVRRFRSGMRRLSRMADAIITNSAYSASRLAHWCRRWGTSPQMRVAHLGVDRPAEVPPAQFDRPSFVVLGTIEPRKNHRLLLDVWARFADMPEPERPALHVIGKRGWKNSDVFDRLDYSPQMGRDIFEHGALAPREVAAMLRGADALLFPSFVEGFGLPLMEAICVKTPTIVSDIAVFRELGGSMPLYLPPTDVTSWQKTIIEQTRKRHSGPPLSEEQNVPNWTDHFARVKDLL